MIYDSNWLPFIFLASLAFAISDTMRRLLGPQVNPLFVTIGTYLIAASVALLTFLLMFKQELNSTLISVQRLWPFFLVGGVALAVGVSSHVYTFRVGAPLSVATPILVSGIIILTSLIGFTLFNESFSFKWVIGIIMIIGGIILLLWR